MPTEAPSRPPASAAGAAGSDDVRRSRIYVLSRGPVVGLLRRALSVGALILADVAGLALGVYVALVLRAVVYGDTIYWSLLWETGPPSGCRSWRRSPFSCSSRRGCTRRASGGRESAGCSARSCSSR